jgi:hypothetical protein
MVRWAMPATTSADGCAGCQQPYLCPTCDASSTSCASMLDSSINVVERPIDASDIAIRPILKQDIVAAIFGAFARRKHVGIMTADGGA